MVRNILSQIVTIYITVQNKLAKVTSVSSFDEIATFQTLWCFHNTGHVNLNNTRKRILIISQKARSFHICFLKDIT